MMLSGVAEKDVVLRALNNVLYFVPAVDNHS